METRVRRPRTAGLTHAHELDERILDAIHRWHIRGEALDEAAIRIAGLGHLPLPNPNERTVRPLRRGTRLHARPAAADLARYPGRAQPPHSRKRPWRRSIHAPLRAHLSHKRHNRRSPPGCITLSARFCTTKRSWRDSIALCSRIAPRCATESRAEPANQQAVVAGLYDGSRQRVAGRRKGGMVPRGRRRRCPPVSSRAMEEQLAKDRPVCVAGTAFAFAALIPDLAKDAVHLHAPGRLAHHGDGRLQRAHPRRWSAPNSTRAWSTR